MRALTTTVLILSALMPASGHAHHSHANLNNDDIRVYSGVVSKYGWTMPHVYMKVKGHDESGAIVEYSIEMGNPSSMARSGWDRNTFKPGDRITWEGAHDRNVKRHYTGLKWAEKTDGTRVGNEGETVAEVMPSTDFTGLWQRADPGGFKPHYRPPEGWPLSDRGRQLVDNFSEHQNPIIECINPGPPKSMLLPYPLEIRRLDDKTFVIERELMEELRYLHFDRDHPPGEPTRMGHSVAWFEGDVLLVETSNFLADRWGAHTGIDSSAQKHLLERFSMSNGGLNLDVEITLTDPVYLTAPVTFTHHWRKLADRAVVQAPCTLESTTLYKESTH